MRQHPLSFAFFISAAWLVTPGVALLRNSEKHEATNSQTHEVGSIHDEHQRRAQETGPCLDSWAVEYDSAGELGCTLPQLLAAIEEKGTFAGCPNHGTALTELMTIFGVTTEDEVSALFQEVCSEAYANEESIPWEGVTGEGAQFDKEYFDGGTYYNEARQDLDDYGVRINELRQDPGQRIKAVHEEAEVKKIDWPVPEVDNMDNCYMNAVMCCWVQDRQANDNNGNCATPYPENCVDSNPADNTDVCYVDLSRSPSSNHVGSGLAIFENNAEADSHCHGFAWSDDDTHASSRFKGNNLHYVSLYDHLYQRGYVRNVPGAPMCGCLDKMPVATRADCTQIDLGKETVYVSFNGRDVTASVYSREIEFNACQSRIKNNDLRSYYRQLYDDGEVPAWKFEKVKKTLKLDKNCPKAINSFLDDQGYEPVPGVFLQSYKFGRRPVAQSGKDGTRGFFSVAKGSTVYNDQKWQLRLQPQEKCHGAKACYTIVNSESGRRIYAQKDKDGVDGVGALGPAGRIFDDQRWRVEHSDCDGTRCYHLINVVSNRRLQTFESWNRIAAYSADADNLFHESRWLISGLPFDLESTQADTPAPTASPTLSPTGVTPKELSGIIIRNVVSGRRLYAQGGRDWEAGLGAGAPSVGPFEDNKWEFKPVSCPGDALSDCFFIVNSVSNRRLYASAGRSWESGVGAVASSQARNDEQIWQLVETPCLVDGWNDGPTCYHIKNAGSDRYLYAQLGKSWESGVGASPAGGVIYKDQVWVLGDDSDFVTLINPGFDLGSTSGWGKNWEATIAAVPTSDFPSQAGTHSALVTTRGAEWDGIVQNVKNKLVTGMTYAVSAWVSLPAVNVDPADPYEMKLTFREGSGTSQTWSVVGIVTVDVANEWVEISGDYTAAADVDIIYVEGPPAGVDYRVDSISVVPIVN